MMEIRNISNTSVLLCTDTEETLPQKVTTGCKTGKHVWCYENWKYKKQLGRCLSVRHYHNHYYNQESKQTFKFSGFLYISSWIHNFGFKNCSFVYQTTNYRCRNNKTFTVGEQDYPSFNTPHTGFIQSYHRTIAIRLSATFSKTDNENGFLLQFLYKWS